MQFKDYFTEVYLGEGANETLALRKLEKRNLSHKYDDLAKIDRTPTKKHLPKLVDFYLETIPIETIKDYYNRFINSKLVNTDINSYKNFNAFEKAIDAVPSNIKPSSEIDIPPVYEDANVKIWRANNKIDAIKIGGNYSFCISNPNPSGNMYYGYRFRRGSTFYFVRFKHKTNAKTAGNFEDPNHFIVIDVGQLENEESNLEITRADNGSQGGGTTDTTQEKIIDEFPELQPAFDANVFTANPLTEKERNDYNYVTSLNASILQFNYEQKLLYINIGSKINDQNWNYLDTNLKRLYINTGIYDLTDYQKKDIAGSGLEIRYQEMLEKRVEMKWGRIQDGISFTSDEKKYIQNNPNSFKIPKDTEYALNTFNSIMSIGGTEAFKNLTPQKQSLYIYLKFLSGEHVPDMLFNLFLETNEKDVRKALTMKIKKHGLSVDEVNYMMKHLPIFEPFIKKENTSNETIMSLLYFIQDPTTIMNFIDNIIGKERIIKSIMELYRQNSSTNPLHMFSVPIASKINIIDHLGGPVLIKMIDNYLNERNKTPLYDVVKQLVRANRMDVVKRWGLLHIWKNIAQTYPAQSTYTDTIQLDRPDVAFNTKLAYLLSQLKYLESQIVSAISYTNDTPYQEKTKNHLYGYRGKDLSMEYLLNFLKKITDTQIDENTFKRLFLKHIITCLKNAAKLEGSSFYNIFGHNFLQYTSQYQPGLDIIFNYVPPQEIPQFYHTFFFKAFFDLITQKYHDDYNYPKFINFLKVIPQNKIDVWSSIIHYIHNNSEFLENIKPSDEFLKLIPSEALTLWLDQTNSYNVKEVGRPFIYYGYGTSYVNPFYYTLKSRGQLSPEQIKEETPSEYVVKYMDIAKNIKNWKSLINPEIIQAIRDFRKTNSTHWDKPKLDEPEEIPPTTPETTPLAQSGNSPNYKPSWNPTDHDDPLDQIFDPKDKSMDELYLETLIKSNKSLKSFTSYK